MITDCNQNESILELASKLAIYAAENARKRQRETKDEIGKTLSLITMNPTFKIKKILHKFLYD